MLTWTAGKYGNGISLDETDDYVSPANPSTLNSGTNDFTIATWVKRQRRGNHYFGAHASSGPDSFCLLLGCNVGQDCSRARGRGSLTHHGN